MADESSVTKPLEQSAQKCAWCYNYILGGYAIDIYNGSDPNYQGWICHAECNLEKIIEVNKDNIKDKE
jgi:hypothetical protein